MNGEATTFLTPTQQHQLHCRQQPKISKELAGFWYQMATFRPPMMMTSTTSVRTTYFDRPTLESNEPRTCMGNNSVLSASEDDRNNQRDDGQTGVLNLSLDDSRQRQQSNYRATNDERPILEIESARSSNAFNNQPLSWSIYYNQLQAICKQHQSTLPLQSHESSLDILPLNLPACRQSLASLEHQKVNQQSRHVCKPIFDVKRSSTSQTPIQVRTKVVKERGQLAKKSIGSTNNKSKTSFGTGSRALNFSIPSLLGDELWRPPRIYQPPPVESPGCKSSETKLATNRYSCKHCPRVYSTLTGLSRHQLHKHPISTTPSASTMATQLPSTLLMTDTSFIPSSMDQPKSSTTVLPTVDSFSKKHGDKPVDPHHHRPHSCHLCAKVYFSLSALKMHVRTHTLPCKCQLCGKAFSRMWLLNGHLRTHTGEKPFACSDCGRAFADRSNLRAHAQTHSQVKRYACRRCDRTFSRMGLLTKHQQQCCSVGGRSGRNSSNSSTSGCSSGSLPAVARWMMDVETGS